VARGKWRLILLSACAAVLVAAPSVAAPAAAGATLPAGLVPAPQSAGNDMGRLFADGCMAWAQVTVSPPCVYGKPGSSRRVIVFGDSRAMQYFDPLLPVARKRSWRLVGLVRGNCLVAQVVYERYCDRWRENSLRRIEREDPDLVIVGSATKGMYSVTHGGIQLSRGASQPFLVRGFAETLRRIKRTGAKVLVIRDQTLAPFSPPECLLGEGGSLETCTYPAAYRLPRAFELTGARRVGVRTIDPEPVFCPDGQCRPVAGRILVFRDRYHLSATYARTMRSWLMARLPAIRD
jgi:hypothetical protein